MGKQAEGSTIQNRVVVLVRQPEQEHGLVRLLEGAGYATELVSEGNFQSTICAGDHAPVAVILCGNFEHCSREIAQALSDMRKQCQCGVPVISLTGKKDLALRLAAYKMGANRCLSLPEESNYLLQLIAEAIPVRPADAYRVMLVGEKNAQLDEHAGMLTSAGMEVRAIFDPLSVLPALEQFAADIIVLCIENDEGSWPELAVLLSDEKRVCEIPLIFAASEATLLQRLKSIDSTEESFLSRLVGPGQMMAVIRKRAHSYRRAQEQAKTLRAMQYELTRQQQALDSHAIVSLTDINGTIVYVNDKFCQISGYTREELIGQNHRIVKSGQHSGDFYSDMWDTVVKGRIWHGEVCNRRKSGNLYWVDTSIVPFMDEEGFPYQYISIRTEITQVKENELRLDRSQAFANIGTWDWDIQSGEQIWSERMEPLLGYAGKNIEHTYENFLKAIHPEDLEKVSEAIRNCVERGFSYHIEHRCIWPDGSIRWLLQSGDAVRDQNETPLHMLGLVQDITARKQSEQALLLAKETAEMASHAKSDFLASMSHELRTPLNAILGFSQLFMLDQQLPEDTRNNAAQIEQAGEHLLSLVDDLIDLARIEANKLEISMEAVSISAVMGDSMDMVASMAQKRGMQILLKQCDVMEITVLADFKRLRQALINLLTNAIKYNRPHEPIHVECVLVEAGLRLVVTDHGFGIPAEKQARIFNAFDRLGAERGDIEGTGIGLVITKRIVDAMGGRIGFESEEGRGSTFWLEFPVTQHQQYAEKGFVEHASAGHATELRANKTSYAVLYVEDNPINLRLMQQIFQMKKEWELRSANDGETGIEMARLNPPDLILMDINLPGMNGYQALEVLGEMRETAHIPVIALTANAMKGDMEAGMAAGFAGYLTKPLDIPKLLQLLEQQLVS